MSRRANRQLENKVTIALGKTAYSSDIVQKKITIKSLFEGLKKVRIRDKKDGDYFIFASFSKDQRNAHNLNQYYGVTLDIDDSQVSLDYIKSKLTLYTYYMYTTYNHKIKGDRYRFIIPYKIPVAPERHVDVVMYLADKIGMDSVDLSSKTLSAPAYLPSSSRENKHNFECYTNLGLLLNPESETIRDKVPELRFEKYDQSTTKESISLSTEISEGERNSALSRVAGKFIGQGLSLNDVLDMSMAYNEKKIIPPLDDNEVKTIVESVYKTHSRNHGDISWGFDEIMRRIELGDAAKNDFTHLCRIIAHGQLHKKLNTAQLEMAISELRQRSGVSKKVINECITKESYDLQGKDEELLEEVIHDQSENIKTRFKNWVYVGTDDRMYNTITGEFYKKEAFNVMFHSSDLKSAIFNILVKYNLIAKVARLEFDPERGPVYTRDKIKYANTYIAPDIDAIPGDVEPMLEHFRYIIPNRRERKIVLDYIAHLVQHPGRKIRWMLVIKGPKGVGKSLIAETVIRSVIGFNNIGKVENHLIKSDFNAWQLNKQLVVFEELDVGGTYKEKKLFTDRLKSFITDNILKAHRKGIDPYDVVNKACCMGFTNAEEPIIITTDERRFCMIRVEAAPKEDNYYRKFVRFCEKNKEQIYYYFMNRNIEGFKDIRAPYTEYTEELKAMSMPWPSSILYELITNKFPEYAKHQCLTNTQLIDFIKMRSTGKYRAQSDDLYSPGTYHAKNLALQLRDLGFKKLHKPGLQDQRFLVNGRKETIWMFPKCAKSPEYCRSASTRQALGEMIIDPKEENWDE